MQPIRTILVSGFLGAGKTTVLERGAQFFQAQGKRVGLITNDQAPDLVDSEILRGKGFAVGEVAGGCFCCRFDQLVTSLAKVREANSADILLAEPVGSCTDISATVVQPLKHLYADRFQLAPVTTLVDPFRLREALAESPSKAFPSSVYYIFQKQLEEADIIAINKADLVPAEELLPLQASLEAQFPATPIVAMSARTGAGFDEWLSMIGSPMIAGRSVTDVDYDVYAEGEAVLGWLNARIMLHAPGGADWRAYCERFLENMKEATRARRAEAAHIKIILSTADGSIAGNLTMSSVEPELRGQADGRSPDASLIVNARVHMAAQDLRNVFETCLTRSGQTQIQHRILSVESFSPARPQPTHRYSSAV